MDRRDNVLAGGADWCFGLFRAHPQSVGETYFGHLCFAARFGASMMLGGLACMLHGLLPFCLTTSGSRRVRALHGSLSAHQARGSDMARRCPDAGDHAFSWTI